MDLIPQVLLSASKSRDKLILRANGGASLQHTPPKDPPDHLPKLQLKHRLESSIHLQNLSKNLKILSVYISDMTAAELHHCSELKTFLFSYRSYMRQLSYEIHEAEYWHLPPPPTLSTWAQNNIANKHHRHFCSRRVAWLLQDDNGNLPATQRYTNFFSVHNVYNTIGDNYPHLTKPRTCLDLEHEMVVPIVGKLEALRHQIAKEKKMVRMVEFLLKWNPEYPIPVKNFTSAVFTADEVKAEKENCFVCMRPYSTQTDDETEQPLKLHCGHLIGEQCLRQYIQQNFQRNNKCPYRCNTKLYSYGDLLPKEISEVDERIREHLAPTEDLDGEIDKFLLQGVRDVYEPCTKDFLLKLMAWNERFDVLHKELVGVVYRYVRRDEGEIGMSGLAQESWMW